MSTLYIKVKKISMHKIQYFFENYSQKSLDMYNALFQIYRIKPDGRIHLYTKYIRVKAVDEIHVNELAYRQQLFLDHLFYNIADYVLRLRKKLSHFFHLPECAKHGVIRSFSASS